MFQLMGKIVYTISNILSFLLKEYLQFYCFLGNNYDKALSIVSLINGIWLNGIIIYT